MTPLSSTARRRLAAGLLAGAVIGSWTAWQARKITFKETKPGMIDWDRVRSIATSMNRGSSFNATLRTQLDAEYRSLVAHTIPLVSDYTGDTLPGELSRVYAFDRIDWIDANIEVFKSMFAPIERLSGNKGVLSGRAAAIWSSLNQTVLSAEVGFMLGYLARRVLGQYDLALLGREPLGTSGKLYFVQPNISGVESTLQVEPVQFRLWLALHETTHAFEFETHPWVRDHMNSMLEEYFSLLTDDVKYLERGVEALKMFWNRARSNNSDTGSFIDYVMSDRQRALFARMQALMAIIEGYSNHVMNAVGQHLMPDYAHIKRQFERRQTQRSSSEQFFAKLTGLNIKLEQYRLGESFIDAVAEQRGHGFARQVWRDAESLPTLSELRNPEAWIRRIDAGSSASEEST